MSTTTDTDRLLLRIADRTIRRALATGRRADPDPTGLPHELHEPGASFVTLTERGELQGCIGSMVPVRPLWLDVARNALAAAFDDPRMPSLTVAQFPRTTIAVSVLSPLEPLEVADRADLLTRVRPGVDGLLVSAPGVRGTFLPSVWEELPEPTAFLEALWRKAGLRPGSWPAGLRVERYTTRSFEDPAPRPPVVPEA
jgi:AmmeMemoRadiSam system protein A